MYEYIPNHLPSLMCCTRFLFFVFVHVFDTAMNVSYTLTSSVMTSEALQTYLVGSSFVWLLSDTVHKIYPAFTATVPHVTILQGMKPEVPSYPTLPISNGPTTNGLSYAMDLMFIVVGGVVLVGLMKGYKYCCSTAKGGARVGQKEYELLGTPSRGDDEIGLSESDDEHDRNDGNDKRNGNGQYEQVSTSISL